LWQNYYIYANALDKTDDEMGQILWIPHLLAANLIHIIDNTIRNWEKIYKDAALFFRTKRSRKVTSSKIDAT